MYGPEAASGGVATHTKNLVEELEKLGVVIVHHSCSGSIYNKFYQRTFGLFFKSIKRREEYDIIHIQASGGMFSFISAITGTFVTKLLNKKLVITFHYSKTQDFVTNHKFSFTFVLNYSDKLILVSHKQKEAFTSIFGKMSEKINVIPNGYNRPLYHFIDKDKCRGILKIPINKKIIFNISNLIESKGHKYLLLAISNVITSHNNFSCYIAGKGYLKETLNAVVTDLQLQDYVTFLGWIPDDQIPLWMNAADLFVLPSLNEGNPIVMFEALGCGTPVIGTKVGGIPEIINSDTYGLLVEPGNSCDLAEKVIIGLDKVWKRGEISRYAKQFTWENIANEIVNIYMQVSR